MRWLFASTVTFLAVFGAKTALCAEDVTLGATVSLTGKYALNGVNTKNGYDLAIRQINDKGGVKIGGKSRTQEVRYYDDESTPARGTELVERLMQQDGVNFMLGPYSSGLTKAILPIIQRHKVPMVEANGAARELFTKGYRYIFAVLSTSDQYLRRALELAAAHAGKLGKSAGEVSFAMATANDPSRKMCGPGCSTTPCASDQLCDRRPVATRARRHVGDARQGESAEARPSGGLGPREGGADRRQTDRGAADGYSHGRAHPLRFGAAGGAAAEGRVPCVLCPSMAPLARPQGQAVRLGGRLRAAFP
jgi:hypothetical protein